MLNSISTFLAQGKTDSLRSRLIRGAIGSAGLKIAGAGLTFVKIFTFARLLGTEGLGVYSYAITWVGLLSIPATLGLPQLLVREVAIYQSQSAWGLISGLLQWSNRLVMVFSTVLALIAVVVAWFLQTGNDSQMLLALYVAIVSLPIACLTSLKLSAMRGLHKVILGQLPETLIIPVLLITFTGLGYLVLREGLNANWVVAIHILATSITFIVVLKLLRQVVPEVVKDATHEYQARRWLRSSLPLMFLGGMHIINSQTDVLMLGAIKGTENVGIYVVANRLASSIVFVLIAVNSVLAPNIAGLYAEGNLEQLQQLVTKSSRVIFLFSFPIAISFIFFGYWFIILFGSDFTEGKNTLAILSFGQLVNASMGSVSLLLTMTGHENYTVVSVGVGAILNILLNALLIPIWSINGAAFATAFSTIVWNFLGFVWIKKELNIDSTAFKFF